jgi:predicted SAM-dependent methyltransferase
VTAILDVGAGTTSLAKAVWGESEGITIETLDIDPRTKPTYVHDMRHPFPATMWNRYAAVMMHHVLEHVKVADVARVLQNVRQVLLPRGLVHIMVPSLEWVADQVNYAEQVSPVLLSVIFGSQANEHQMHLSGFTLPILREMVVAAGFAVRRAEINDFLIRATVDGEAKEFPAGQIYIVAEWVGGSDGRG